MNKILMNAIEEPDIYFDTSPLFFAKLREKISELYGEPWASHYASLRRAPAGIGIKEFYTAFCEKTQKMIEDQEVPDYLVQFCLLPDTDGTISYQDCEKLLELIGDYEDNFIYDIFNEYTIADFKELLRECIDKQCELGWGTENIG